MKALLTAALPRFSDWRKTNTWEFPRPGKKRSRKRSRPARSKKECTNKIRAEYRRNFPLRKAAGCRSSSRSPNRKKRSPNSRKERTKRELPGKQRENQRRSLSNQPPARRALLHPVPARSLPRRHYTNRGGNHR